MQAQHELWHRHFLLKDIYDNGLAVVTGVAVEHSHSSMDVLPAIAAMDTAFDAEGKPDYDLHIWMGLSRLLINAGDILAAAVKVNVTWNRADQQADSWFFHYDLEGPLASDLLTDLTQRLPARAFTSEREGELPWGAFLKLRRFQKGSDLPLEEVIRLAGADLPTYFPVKKMGEIDPNPNTYRAKLEAYPMSVHPRMAQRAVSTIHFMIALYLINTGLTVREHWFPEDTSQGFARYLLSDGVEHYLLDFDGPALTILLAHLDAYAGRTEEEGAILLDGSQQPPTLSAVLSDENPDLPT